ncbi:hypothetical protein M885DRAFT_610594 [Pelagophyceae sp. CCMP2097]|nr:hypothetical protein M885DRAFT_610594 [Pelagophyceae sp. CCMP2097]
MSAPVARRGRPAARRDRRLCRGLLALAFSPASAQLQSTSVLGRFEREGTRILPAIIGATCFEGMKNEFSSICEMRLNDGVLGGGWDYTRSDGYNLQAAARSDLLCLTCCSNLYLEPRQRIDETWDLQCEISTDARPALVTDLYGFEFRFSRNKFLGDDAIVRCPLGRVGCEYEDPDGNFDLHGRSLTCTADPNDGDFGYCNADRSECHCDLPGSIRGGTGPSSEADDRLSYNDGIRVRGLPQKCALKPQFSAEAQNWAVIKYKLVVDVEEMANSKGDYWRSVTGCHVETTEVSQDLLQEGGSWFQEIQLLGPRKPAQYKWWDPDYGLPIILVSIFLMILAAYFAVAAIRDDTCPTCGKALVFSRTQCVVCFALDMPMPDPVLLARLRARARQTRGAGLVAHSLERQRSGPRTRFQRFFCCVFRVCLATAVVLGKALERFLRFLVATFIKALKWLFVAATKAAFGADFDAPEDGAKPAAAPQKRAAVQARIYVVDAQLRTENAFAQTARPVSKRERELARRGNDDDDAGTDDAGTVSVGDNDVGALDHGGVEDFFEDDLPPISPARRSSFSLMPPLGNTSPGKYATGDALEPAAAEAAEAQAATEADLAEAQAAADAPSAKKKKVKEAAPLSKRQRTLAAQRALAADADAADAASRAAMHAEEDRLRQSRSTYTRLANWAANVAAPLRRTRASKTAPEPGSPPRPGAPS